MTTGPEDPIGGTPMTDAAVGVHEMYVSLLAAGFSKWDALRLLGVMLAERGEDK